jgi:hypothetical protein
MRSIFILHLILALTWDTLQPRLRLTDLWQESQPIWLFEKSMVQIITRNVAVQLCNSFSDFTGVFDAGNFGALILSVYWRLTIGVSKHFAGESSQVFFSYTATLAISTFFKKTVMNIYTVTCIPIARQRLCQHVPAMHAHATIGGHSLSGNGPVNTHPKQ